MVSESTPLLNSTTTTKTTTKTPFFSPFRRLLLTTLALSISFVLTATTLIYSFKVFACEEYYDNHPELTRLSSTIDRCNIKEVEASFASAVSLMVTFTTISGVLNLLTTNYLIVNKGVKFAMICQTFFPCFRNIAQTIAMILGGRTGINIVTFTQVITVLGGGAGYLLCANTFVTELVEPEERTAAFGILQGTTMAGTAIGFILGGIINDNFGLEAPFEFTLGLLIFSTILSALFLPYITPPIPTTIDGEVKSSGIMSFMKPLKVFVPNKGLDGQRHYGLMLLGSGAFTGVLATAYVPLMLQMTATNMFGFGPSENGYLMSLNSSLRALFLTIFFPRIIKSGRRLYSSPSLSSSSSPTPSSPSTPPQIPTSIDSFEPLPPVAVDTIIEPIQLPTPTNLIHGCQFDLVFLRLSMLADAILTGLTAFASSGYHMYIAAAILPFASGTAPAAKGVIMEMVLKEDQPSALSAIALLESLATTLTVSLFGMIFAILSEAGMANLVFLLNGGTALVAAGILFWVRFPPVVKNLSSC